MVKKLLTPKKANQKRSLLVLLIVFSLFGAILPIVQKYKDRNSTSNLLSSAVPTKEIANTAIEDKPALENRPQDISSTNQSPNIMQPDTHKAPVNKPDAQPVASPPPATELKMISATINDYQYCSVQTQEYINYIDFSFNKVAEKDTTINFYIDVSSENENIFYPPKSAIGYTMSTILKAGSSYAQASAAFSPGYLTVFGYSNYNLPAYIRVVATSPSYFATSFRDLPHLCSPN